MLDNRRVAMSYRLVRHRPTKTPAKERTIPVPRPSGCDE